MSLQRQPANLFIFFSDLISLRLLFCGLVQVIGLCGTFGVVILPIDTVPGGLFWGISLDSRRGESFRGV